MLKYILKRLVLIPLTLFSVIAVNFLILNVAPGEPLEDQVVNSEGSVGRGDQMRVYKGPDRYLQFREHYGLTLPIFFNTYPLISHSLVQKGIQELVDAAYKRYTGGPSFSKLKIFWGDRAKFIMPILLFEAKDKQRSDAYRHVAADLFIRGGIKQGFAGAQLSHEQQMYNQKVASSNATIVPLLLERDIEVKVLKLQNWFQQVGMDEPSKPMWKIFFLDTRFAKYMSRVLHLDFGTLRNDPHKTVISEVTKRLGSSLVLSILPMIVVFILCQVFGMTMALHQGRWIDHILNFLFLLLFSIPIFVAVPWIIDHFVVNKMIPFTSMPVPYSGLHSAPEIFNQLSSWDKIIDLITHCFLPFCAVSYGAFAAQTRLSRYIFLEILNEDYIRAAYARGLSHSHILTKHVGKNAAVSLITPLASSLSSLLGGALIIETLFDIDGFGKFFYHAILNRDHNVVLFSVLMGSVLSLVGYLIGDICCMLLDPRIRLEGRKI